MEDIKNKDKMYEQVNNYTKFKLVEMMINKYKDKTLNDLNAIEQLSEDVLNVLSLCGMKYYQELQDKFGNNKED